MILLNLPRMISCAMRNAKISQIATYGGTLEVSPYLLFFSSNAGSNGRIKNRMQNYYTNENPYNSMNSNYLNVLICAGTGTTPPHNR